MVFYLKYRPQKFSDLDSESVRETLEAVLSSKKSSFHAFLFTGPKGLGKTSTARIVAKFLNCEKRKPGEFEPCNKCYQCRSITNGNNLDVLEIDAASNRGIEEIRTLRDQVKLSTAGGKFKVYIIDEVHMLTNEAFNALLKTLEEPPAHVVFILCTTEPQKVPATIASRCLNVLFRKASSDELVHSLKRIIKGEDLNVDSEALSEIAKLSDGSFRDAAKILQELSSRNKKISKELVDNFFHSSNIGKHIGDMRHLLFNKNIKGALGLVADISGQGLDIKYFLEELIEELHNEFLLEVMGTGEKKELIFSVEELKKLIELLSRAHQETKFAVLPQLPLELAIVEWSLTKQNVQTPSVQIQEKPVVQAQNETKTEPTKENNFLSELITKVNSENHSIAGLLRGATLGKMNGKKVILEAKYKFHKEKLEEEKTLSLLEKLAGEILKKNVTIEIVLGGVK